MITLLASQLHWITETDEGTDQCVHGELDFRVGSTVVVAPGSGPWNLTMAGLYLLRTLESDHTPEQSVAAHNYLIPCCGHSPWIVDGGNTVVCPGCNSGINPGVLHVDGQILLRVDLGHTETVTANQWRGAVLEFVRAIERFYEQAAPREQPVDDLHREGWQAFWEEWRSRRDRARAAG